MVILVYKKTYFIDQIQLCNSDIIVEQWVIFFQSSFKVEKIWNHFSQFIIFL